MMAKVSDGRSVSSCGKEWSGRLHKADRELDLDGWDRGEEERGRLQL